MLTSPKMSIQTRGDAIVGKWLKIPKKDMIIEVYRVEDEYKGKISWTIDEESKPTGFLILEDLQYNSKKQVWENGKVYDPVSGGVYSATARLDAGGTLEVMGYKGMKFFGITKYFERVK
jgi:Uncharacterized protein conserved in bacteria